ncbi:DNA mismatch repair endonuclease MutL [Alphaproteobacteria bacterium]|nr:DNA mismatch repair endonuclease MutL [Alphaproteobacteria bacterium]
MEIRRLPENLINQIAAGEVVERPSSALKELIENSIDAKSTQINIVIEDGGKNLISVSDNGIGIEKEYVPLSVERHATSKLPNNDLIKIDYLGFRGEALPSIAAVSELNIQTKSINSNDAWALDVIAGNIKVIYPSSRQSGTMISVKKLFFATPARLKFLKSSQVESSYCHQTILKQALVNPKIGFKFQANDKELLNINPEIGQEDLFLRRITNIMGKDFSEEAIKIKNSKLIKEENFAKLHGLIGLPTMNKSNHNQQHLFINGRYIQDRNLSGAIRAAYRDTLPKGRFPLFCLFIDVPPDFIDVNVHPGKTEVRFQDNALIRSLLVGSISRELNASFSQTTGDISKEAINRFDTYTITNTQKYVNENQSFFNNSGLSPSIKPIENYNEGNVVSPNDQQDHFPLGVALAQFNKNYIISRNSNGIVIVDQHAAHERLVLEKMKFAQINKFIEKQILLLPEVINLEPIPLALIIENIDLLSDIGFVIEPFGEGMVIVREIPALIGHADIKQIIIDLGDDLSSAGLPSSYIAKIDLILGNIACHRSVRSGRVLNETEMNNLLREMEITPNSGQCNHGRPTSISLSLKDIEKLFNRT